MCWWKPDRSARAREGEHCGGRPPLSRSGVGRLPATRGARRRGSGGALLLCRGWRFEDRRDHSLLCSGLAFDLGADLIRDASIVELGDDVQLRPGAVGHANRQRPDLTSGLRLTVPSGNSLSDELPLPISKTLRSGSINPPFADVVYSTTCTSRVVIRLVECVTTRAPRAITPSGLGDPEQRSICDDVLDYLVDCPTCGPRRSAFQNGGPCRTTELQSSYEAASRTRRFREL